MSNVIPIGGVTRLDIDPDQILKEAVGEMVSCFVIGYTKEGDLYMASSLADGAELNWLLDRAKIQLHKAAYDLEEE